MATTERRNIAVDMADATSDLARLVADLDEHPDRVYSLVRNEEPAAILLNPETFERLLEVAQDVLDVQDAENVLATEPLTSFHEYHARRLARRQASGQ